MYFNYTVPETQKSINIIKDRFYIKTKIEILKQNKHWFVSVYG